MPEMPEVEAHAERLDRQFAGRLLADTKLSAKPRSGQARFIFEPIERDDGGIDETALLLTEQGKERRAGLG